MDKLKASLQAGTYETRAALDALKGELLQGKRPDSQTTLKLLLLALANFQQRDFSLFLALLQLPQAEFNQGPVALLSEMERALEGGAFSNFWSLWAQRGELQGPANFEDTIRMSMLKVLSESVVKMSEKQLALNLGVTDVAGLIAAAKTVKATIANGDVVFAKNEFNSPEPSSNSEKLRGLEQIANIVAK